MSRLRAFIISVLVCCMTLVHAAPHFPNFTFYGVPSETDSKNAPFPVGFNAQFGFQNIFTIKLDTTPELFKNRRTLYVQSSLPDVVVCPKTLTFIPPDPDAADPAAEFEDARSRIVSCHFNHVGYYVDSNFTITVTGHGEDPLDLSSTYMVRTTNLWARTKDLRPKIEILEMPLTQYQDDYLRFYVDVGVAPPTRLELSVSVSGSHLTDVVVMPNEAVPSRVLVVTKLHDDRLPAATYEELKAAGMVRNSVTTRVYVSYKAGDANWAALPADSQEVTLIDNSHHLLDVDVSMSSGTGCEVVQRSPSHIVVTQGCSALAVGTFTPKKSSDFSYQVDVKPVNMPAGISINTPGVHIPAESKPANSVSLTFANVIVDPITFGFRFKLTNTLGNDEFNTDIAEPSMLVTVVPLTGHGVEITGPETIQRHPDGTTSEDAAYSVSLRGPPPATMTVRVHMPLPASGDFSLTTCKMARSPTTTWGDTSLYIDLTFTANTWNVPQKVYVFCALLTDMRLSEENFITAYLYSGYSGTSWDPALNSRLVERKVAWMSVVDGYLPSDTMLLADTELADKYYYNLHGFCNAPITPACRGVIIGTLRAAPLEPVKLELVAPRSADAEKINIVNPIIWPDIDSDKAKYFAFYVELSDAGRTALETMDSFAVTFELRSLRATLGGWENAVFTENVEVTAYATGTGAIGKLCKSAQGALESGWNVNDPVVHWYSWVSPRRLATLDESPVKIKPYSSVFNPLPNQPDRMTNVTSVYNLDTYTDNPVNVAGGGTVFLSTATADVSGFTTSTETCAILFRQDVINDEFFSAERQNITHRFDFSKNPDNSWKALGSELYGYHMLTEDDKPVNTTSATIGAFFKNEIVDPDGTFRYGYREGTRGVVSIVIPDDRPALGGVRQNVSLTPCKMDENESFSDPYADEALRRRVKFWELPEGAIDCNSAIPDETLAHDELFMNPSTRNTTFCFVSETTDDIISGREDYRLVLMVTTEEGVWTIFEHPGFSTTEDNLDVKFTVMERLEDAPSPGYDVVRLSGDAVNEGGVITMLIRPSVQPPVDFSANLSVVDSTGALDRFYVVSPSDGVINFVASPAMEYQMVLVAVNKDDYARQSSLLSLTVSPPNDKSLLGWKVVEASYDVAVIEHGVAALETSSIQGALDTQSDGVGTAWFTVSLAATPSEDVVLVPSVSAASGFTDSLEYFKMATFEPANVTVPADSTDPVTFMVISHGAVSSAEQAFAASFNTLEVTVTASQEGSSTEYDGVSTSVMFSSVPPSEHIRIAAPTTAPVDRVTEMKIYLTKKPATLPFTVELAANDTLAGLTWPTSDIPAVPPTVVFSAANWSEVAIVPILFESGGVLREDRGVRIVAVSGDEMVETIIMRTTDGTPHFVTVDKAIGIINSRDVAEYGQFSVSLSHKPSDDVIVQLSNAALKFYSDAALTTEISSLTFTSASYAAAQAVFFRPTAVGSGFAITMHHVVLETTSTAGGFPVSTASVDFEVFDPEAPTSPVLTVSATSPVLDGDEVEVSVALGGLASTDPTVYTVTMSAPGSTELVGTEWKVSGGAFGDTVDVTVSAADPVAKAIVHVPARAIAADDLSIVLRASADINGTALVYSTTTTVVSSSPVGFIVTEVLGSIQYASDAAHARCAQVKFQLESKPERDVAVVLKPSLVGPAPLFAAQPYSVRADSWDQEHTLLVCPSGTSQAVGQVTTSAFLTVDSNVVGAFSSAISSPFALSIEDIRVPEVLLNVPSAVTEGVSADALVWLPVAPLGAVTLEFDVSVSPSNAESRLAIEYNEEEVTSITATATELVAGLPLKIVPVDNDIPDDFTATIKCSVRSNSLADGIFNGLVNSLITNKVSDDVPGFLFLDSANATISNLDDLGVWSHTTTSVRFHVVLRARPENDVTVKLMTSNVDHVSLSLDGATSEEVISLVFTPEDALDPHPVVARSAKVNTEVVIIRAIVSEADDDNELAVWTGALSELVIQFGEGVGAAPLAFSAVTVGGVVVVLITVVILIVWLPARSARMASLKRGMIVENAVKRMELANGPATPDRSNAIRSKSRGRRPLKENPIQIDISDDDSSDDALGGLTFRV